MPDYFVGANYPPIKFQVVDEDENAFDNLGAYTFSALRINDAAGASAAAGGSVTVDDAASAKAKYTPGGTDISTAGTYTIRVTFTKGSQIFILDLPEKMVVK